MKRFIIYRTLLDTLLSLQPQRAVTQGESREDKVVKGNSVHILNTH